MAENTKGRHLLTEKDFVDVVDDEGNDLPPVPKHWGEDQLPAGAKVKSKGSTAKKTAAKKSTAKKAAPAKTAASSPGAGSTGEDSGSADSSGGSTS